VLRVTYRKRRALIIMRWTTDEIVFAVYRLDRMARERRGDLRGAAPHCTLSALPTRALAASGADAKIPFRQSC